MPAKLVRLRSQAFFRQQGRCCYCDLPMWMDNPQGFAEVHGITLAQAHWHQCTAEHLLARQEGGPDSEANIAAACKWCNMRRHRGAKEAPTPDQYRMLVRNRLAQRRWDRQWVFTNRMLADARMVSSTPKRIERHA